MSVLKNMARGAGATMLAQKSGSFEAFDGGTIARSIEPHTARDYFRKYGTMPQRFDYNPDYNVYYGYVSTFNRPEFLSFVAFKNGHTIIISYETHMHGIHGAEAWELRQHFVDQCMLKVRLKVLTFVAPVVVAFQSVTPSPSPSPPPPPPIATPISKKKKGSGSLWWSLALLFIVGAGFFGYEYVTKAQETPFDVGNAVELGMNDFNATYREDGMMGARFASSDCHRLAKRIEELDRCAAFDITAMTMDSAFSSSFGSMPQTYFSLTDERLRSAYSQYSVRYDQRIALIKAEVIARFDKQTSEQF